jgi:hypothetical protein
MEEIFGQNLFGRRTIRKYIIDFCTARIKPFECVGTREESQLALYLSLKKQPPLDFRERPNRRDLELCCQSIDAVGIHRECLETYHDMNNIPRELEPTLKASVRSLLGTPDVG